MDADQPASAATTAGDVQTPPAPTASVRYRIRRPRPIGLAGHVNAAVVDFLIFVAVVTPLLMLLMNVILGFVPIKVSLPSDWSDLAWWLMIGVYSATDVLFAATPGKMLVSLRIRAASGTRPSRRRLLARWALKMSPLPFAALYYNADAIWRVAPSIVWKGGLLAMAQRVAGPCAVVALFIVNAGLLLALLPGRRPLHDRIAGTALFATVDLGSAHEATPGGFEVQPATPSAPPPAPAD